MAKQFKGRKLDKMIWNETLEKHFCPKCDSSRIRVKAGMFCDLFTCLDCGFETRDYIVVRDDSDRVQVVPQKR